MSTQQNGALRNRLSALGEIARTFLKIGAIGYGGPALLGIMQAEIQEKRRWITKEHFVEGLALVNMLPGPIATQLAMFLGYTKAGTAGGIVGGLCFILPAFFILLALTMAYSAYGAVPVMRHALYGVGPVVIGIFAAAVYRLGKSTIKDRLQVILAFAAGIAILFSPLGLVMALLVSGCAGVAFYYSRWYGSIALAGILGVFIIVKTMNFVFFGASPLAATSMPSVPNVWQLFLFFAKVGAFTFGGGLSVLAFMQEQVVNQLSWLTPQEFVDGLALGQLTPGPVVMLAAFVGFKVAGLKGAAVATCAIFLPAFLLMLFVLPALRRLKDVQWLKAFMRGVGPAVIGALAVSLAQMAPHAAPDAFTWFLLIATIAVILARNVGPLPLMAVGALIGVLTKGNAAERVKDLLG